MLEIILSVVENVLTIRQSWNCCWHKHISKCVHNSIFNISLVMMKRAACGKESKRSGDRRTGGGVG